MAVSRRRLLRSTIWAPSNCSIAYPAVVAPVSACARMPSTASWEPGIFRSARIARTRSLRLLAVVIIALPPRSREATGGILPDPRGAQAAQERTNPAQSRPGVPW